MLIIAIYRLVLYVLYLYILYFLIVIYVNILYFFDFFDLFNVFYLYSKCHFYCNLGFILNKLLQKTRFIFSPDFQRNIF